ncbi:Glycosyl transferase family 2 [uncultured Paludibacter sp.]|uniref:Glycosyl transferase family 2 n=1 Tax=uncultured Paludibacter sp. TaxID=497635 RepID=A0A653AGQ0_9BACT|nr:Glycosyl transferase family 2 [uncultured Paludibacter sp.]
MNNSIEIVIVLYQCSLEESVTFRTLNKQLDKITVDYEIVIYNNDKNTKIENSCFLIVNSEENKKLEGAYNFALEKAIKNGKSWILLLDQDTLIPENYFKELENLFSQDISSDLAVIVPKLTSNNKVISPVSVSSLMRFEREINSTGYTNKRINALNSLSLFSVQFINSIGGFSKEYPFDMHDHWCYNQIFKHQKEVYILNISAEHNSSFLNLEENVSINRYKEFLKAESKFIRNELGVFKYMCHKIKLIGRSIKQMAKNKDKRYAGATLKYVFFRF